MTKTPEELYRQWIDLYDKGAPDQAMALTTPDFVMLTPDGKTLTRAEALEFTGQVKAYVTQMQIVRRTTVVRLHTTEAAPGRWLLHATVELAFSSPEGDKGRHAFVEMMLIGPHGIAFDAFSKLAESQSIF